jgi:hypothetical membrane protein
VTFVVLTALAMIEYPGGGSRQQRNSHHYSFFHNFFSDLGATTTSAGHENTASFVLFGIALITVGIALISFGATWRVFAARRGIAVRVSWVYQACAIGSGVACIGIAATPWNLVGETHDYFVRACFTLLAVMVLAMLAVQRRNRWLKRYMLANVAFVLMLVAYVAVVAAGPSLASSGGLMFQVTAQKVMVYATVLNLAYQAHGISREIVPGAATAAVGIR